ncbi:MAG TPA: hypothetical protein VHH73_16725, partial [Verrucomicrobiae bacterium]|nr:hypothetical protein [Verrucomicrobiae bacterium]
ELALAARYLAGQTPELEFLPPKVSAWQQLTTRYSSRKLAYIGAVAGGVVLLVIGAFGVQQIQLSSLRSEWGKMSPRVREVENVQAQIKQYRPWFNESMPGLSMLRRLTEAFPEEGTVTAKAVDLRESGVVTCTGTARSSDALLKTLDRLRKAPEVSDVKMDQLHGGSPVQFGFNFQWGERTQQ